LIGEEEEEEGSKRRADWGRNVWKIPNDTSRRKMGLKKENHPEKKRQ